MKPKRRSGAVPSRAAASEATRVRGRFERLLAAGVGIFSEHALDALLQRVVDSAREVVGARYAALGVLAPDNRSLDQFVTSGMTAEQRARIGDLPQGRGLLGLVIRDPRPIRTRDIRRHPQRYGFPPHHPEMTSFLGVPIAGRGEVYGNLYLTDKVGADEFSDEDEAIAVLLAAQVAAAVENARLHDESHRLLEQIQSMQRQRDLFFAMMNHELRNALTGVYGWAERLVRGREGAVTPAAREVFEAAERTITLLNNFLDLSRLDAGKVRPLTRDLDVGKVVRQAITGLEPSAAEKQVTIREDILNGASTVRTDPVRLAQVLVNLLSNAIRHSPAGGVVRLQVDASGDQIVFHVIDEGPGIPPVVQARLFEPFERFDPDSGVGSGLGLPVSRRIAEVLGGELTVESEVGRGSRFTLRLPAAGPPG